MCQTIDGLTVLACLNDMPASMSEDPANIVIVIRMLSARKGIGDERPNPAGQPLALTPGKSAKKIIDPAFITLEANAQILFEAFQCCCRQIPIEMIPLLLRP